jgi:exosortase A
MVAIWDRSETFAHGFVVPPIVFWLVWRERQRLFAVAPRPSWWVLMPLAAAGFGWLLGELGTVNAASQFAFVAILVLAVPAVLGVPAARTIAFPLAFLFFCVPVGEFMMPRLMEWTADVTVLALQLTGIPVFREGQNFSIPTGRWSVVEACSGVRYLIASLVIGTLYAYLTYHSLKRRLVFIAFSIAVPIFANWVRAYMIVMLGHVSGNKIAVGIDHLIYGWLFFGVVILLMFVIGARWREGEVAAEGPAPQATVSTGAASPRAFLLVTGLIAVAAAVWPLAFRAIEDNELAQRPEVPAVNAVEPWRAAPAGLDAWQPHFRNPAAESHATFHREAVDVGLYVGFYRNQGADRKLVSSDNAMTKAGDRAWVQVRSGTHRVVVDGRAFDARSAELLGPAGERLVAWHWYWIDGRLTASDYRAKALIAWSRLMGHGDDAAAIVVYAPKGKPGEAEAALDAFIGSMGPNIMAALAKTRDSR